MYVPITKVVAFKFFLCFWSLPEALCFRERPAGWTEPEIATPGHSLRDARAILYMHYRSRDPALGESAIRKLEPGSMQDQQ